MSTSGEFYYLRCSLMQLRERLISTTARSEIRVQMDSGRKHSKIIISSSEINDRHGTGVLLGRIFDPAQVVSLISRRDHQVDGKYVQILIPDPLFHRESAKEILAAIFRELPVDEVLVIPHFSDEVRTALLIREISNVPIMTWIMDDSSLEEARIARDLLSKLCALSSIRFVISPAMAVAYEKAFGLGFHVLPPTVSRREIEQFSVSSSARDEILQSRAVMLGNMWNRQWLDGLAAVLQAANWSLDWFGSSADWRKDSLPPCIVPKGFLDECDLRGTLKQYPFAILATGTGDELDAMRSLTLWSLPSRLVFLFAACQIPVLVIGSSESCAAQLVGELGLGTHCAYDVERFRAAVAKLSEPAFHRACCERCRSVADSFCSDGLADWIWESGKSGSPMDMRFEFLESMRMSFALKYTKEGGFE